MAGEGYCEKPPAPFSGFLTQRESKPSQQLYRWVKSRELSCGLAPGTWGLPGSDSSKMLVGSSLALRLLDLTESFAGRPWFQFAGRQESVTPLFSLTLSHSLPLSLAVLTSPHSLYSLHPTLYSLRSLRPLHTLHSPHWLLTFHPLCITPLIRLTPLH